MALGSTHPVNKMRTRDLPWRAKAAVRRADNLATFIYRLSENPGSLDFLEPSEPIRPVQGELYLYFIIEHEQTYGTRNIKDE
jgi:hypothetical protein